LGESGDGDRGGDKRDLIAATIGNVLEWFDFLVYGFFAVTISEVFFPAGNPIPLIDAEDGKVSVQLSLLAPP
jgi:hypothetical protein